MTLSFTAQEVIGFRRVLVTILQHGLNLRISFADPSLHVVEDGAEVGAIFAVSDNLDFPDILVDGNQIVNEGIDDRTRILLLFRAKVRGAA